MLIKKKKIDYLCHYTVLIYKKLAKIVSQLIHILCKYCEISRFTQKFINTTKGVVKVGYYDNILHKFFFRIVLCEGTFLLLRTCCILCQGKCS